MKLFADVSEFSEGIYDLIKSGDYKKFINSTAFGDNPMFDAGFVQGMCWAALFLNANYANYSAKEGDILDEPNNE
jgi:hypothetical protein